jgi:hypothetical protein
MPYAMSDTAGSFATVPVADLLKAMEPIRWPWRNSTG